MSTSWFQHSGDHDDDLRPQRRRRLIYFAEVAAANYSIRNGGRNFFAGQEVGAKLHLTCGDLDSVLSLLSLASRQGGVPDVEDLMSHVAAVAGVDVGADACVGPTPRDLTDLDAVRDLVAQKWDDLVRAASLMNKSDLDPLRPVFFSEEYETEYTNSFDDSMDKGDATHQHQQQQQHLLQQQQQHLLQQQQQHSDEVQVFVASPDLPSPPPPTADVLPPPPTADVSFPTAPAPIAADDDGSSSSDTESSSDQGSGSSNQDSSGGSDTGSSSNQDSGSSREDRSEDDDIDLILSLARADAGASSVASAPPPAPIAIEKPQAPPASVVRVTLPLSPVLHLGQLQEPADDDAFFEDSVRDILSSPDISAQAPNDARNSIPLSSPALGAASHVEPSLAAVAETVLSDSDGSEYTSGGSSSSRSPSLSLNDLASPSPLEKHAVNAASPTATTPPFSLVDAARAAAATPAAKAEVPAGHFARCLLLSHSSLYRRWKLCWLQLLQEAMRDPRMSNGSSNGSSSSKPSVPLPLPPNKLFCEYMQQQSRSMRSLPSTS